MVNSGTLKIRFRGLGFWVWGFFRVFKGLGGLGVLGV